MKGLMVDCINWGGIDCRTDVAAHKQSKKPKNSEDIPLWPFGDELSRLDAICKNCELRFFEIGKRKCRVCGSQEFIERTGLEIQSNGTNRYENSYLKCKHCETPAILIKSE